MKKLISITLAVLGVVFLSSMKVNDESAQISKPIPTNVMKIAEITCIKCHTGGENKKAMRHLNLSEWDKFSPKKQAKKAKEMCEMVSKGEMPPKGYKNPVAALTKDDVNTICDWANSIP